MTIKRYLDVISTRRNEDKIKKKELDVEFNTLRLKIGSKIHKNQGKIILIVSLPSRSGDGKVYDIVLEYDSANIPKDTISLENIPFKLYSNCPSFVFSNAKLFYTNKLVPQWLIKKYDKKIFDAKASAITDIDKILLERSLYMAFKYLQSTGRLMISTINTVYTPVSSLMKLAESIRTPEEVMKSTKKAAAEVNKVQDNKIKTLTKQSSDSRKKTPTTKSTSTQKSGDSTKSTKSIKSTNTTKKI